MNSNDNTRSFVLVLFISLIVLTGYHFAYQVPKQKAFQEQQQLEATKRKVAQAALEKSKKEAITPAIPQLTTPNNALARIPLRTNELRGSIALKGARFDDITLTSYRENVEKNSALIRLLTHEQNGKTYFAEFGWLGDATSQALLPTKETVWNSSNTELTPESPVILTWTNPQGIIFQKKISVDNQSMFTIEQSVINQSSQTLQVATFGLINRNIIEENQTFAISHEGLLGTANNILEEHTYTSLKNDGAVTQPQASGWLGIADKYWLTAIIPDQKQFTSKYSHYLHGQHDKYQADYLGVVHAVPTGKTYKETTRFFAGAKKLATLEAYEKQYSIPLFERAVDFGSLYFLTKPMFNLLHFYYELMGNFGIAILLLTITVKLIMFPLANKSYHSMAQIRELQPEIASLKDRYGEDRIKINQEMMAIYKREKVNPASGCLPLFIQMPVFFALYKVLFVTIEMRHAPFFGWLQDLTAPDSSNIFTLFGLFPWDAPSLLHLGILPIIMTITMIIQQKLNPKPTDPVQAKMIAYMPYIFLIMFKGFPSGLVLYWAWNNTLSIIQQWVITKRHAAQSAKKLKSPRRK